MAIVPILIVILQLKASPFRAGRRSALNVYWRMYWRSIYYTRDTSTSLKIYQFIS